MTWRHPTPEDFDHAHDLRKHEPRPGEVPTALDVALIARDPNIQLSQAVDLIEQYARTLASTARLEAVTEASERIITAIEAPLARGSVNA